MRLYRTANGYSTSEFLHQEEQENLINKLNLSILFICHHANTRLLHVICTNEMKININFLTLDI